jgi:hypothetical protein
MSTEYQVPNFRLGNYATGNYFGKCDICAEEFTGDKRARSCLPCAIKSVEALQAENAKLQQHKEALWPNVLMQNADLKAELSQKALIIATVQVDLSAEVQLGQQRGERVAIELLF